MDNKSEQIGVVKAQFNSIETNPNDPTLLNGTVIIHDFEVSGNNQIITEETCKENMSTLIGKRIACKYIPCENNNGIDALSDHCVYVDKDRDGNEKIYTGTIAIGFINNVYIGDYTDNLGNTKRVLYGIVTLWNDDKYQRIISLLQEWIERGIKIHMSVEYMYYNFSKKDGIETLYSPIIYLSHVLLNSEQRENYAEVLPAFDCAELISFNEKQEWNKSINQLTQTNNKSENIKSDLIINNKNPLKEECSKMEKNKFIKALNDLSFGETRCKIYTELSKVMIATEYENMYISNWDIYDTYFVYETYENDEWVHYKVTYTKNADDTIIVDYSSKAKAEFSAEWVSTNNALKQVEDKENAMNKIIDDLKVQLNTKETEIKTLNSQIKTEKETKDVTMEKFNELTDTVTQLNSRVKELQPLAEQYNKEQYEKSLNSQLSFYEKKFTDIDAIGVFNKIETQELIKKTLNSVEEESKEAKFALNELIVNNVKAIEKQSNESNITLNSVQPTTTMKNLVGEDDGFKKMFGFEK